MIKGLKNTGWYVFVLLLVAGTTIADKLEEIKAKPETLLSKADSRMKDAKSSYTRDSGLVMAISHLDSVLKFQKQAEKKLKTTDSRLLKTKKAITFTTELKAQLQKLTEKPTPETLSSWKDLIEAANVKVAQQYSPL